MSRDLSFWKYDGVPSLTHSEVYSMLSAGEHVDGVADLPITDILASVDKAFAEWDRPEATYYERDDELIEVYTTPQFVRFDCCGVSEDNMNQLIDVMLAFDCPLYDAAIDTRFDANTLSRDEASDYYYVRLQELLAQDGFKRQNKSNIVRKIGKDSQGVTVIVTKYGSYSEITFNVNYTYQDIDKIASYIQGIPYQKGFSTGCFREHDIPARKCSCRHKVYSGITDKEVESFAIMDYETIRDHFYALLELCDTPEKFLAALDQHEVVRKSLVFGCHIEWIRIAALLYLGMVEQALERFDVWDEPIDYHTRKPVSSEEAKYSRYRIATWEVGRKLKNDYQMFGAQAFGKILPVPENFESWNRI